MITQIYAVLALKLTLMRNTRTPSRTLAMLLGGIVAIVILSASAALSVLLYWMASRPLAKAEPLMLLGALDGLVVFFLFMWGAGMLAELQRGDRIDFRRMLHFPISLRIVFLMNFLASLFSPALLFFVPCSVALLFGLHGRGAAVLAAGLPLAAVFFLMLAAWAYYVRGLLAILMENKRRRRIVLTALPIFFVIIGQIPYLLSTVLLTDDNVREARAWLEQRGIDRDLLSIEPWLISANLVFPPAWMPYGVWSLTQGRIQPALAGIAGMGAITLLGLTLGYRSTVRFYTGDLRGDRKKRPARRRPAHTALTARSLPLLGEDTAAMTFAAFLNYLRHPNVRILLVMPLITGLALLLLYRFGVFSGRWRGESFWLPAAVLIWPFVNFGAIVFNIFGTDRANFRGFILLPLPRHKFLLAKNLALLPFVAGLSAALVLAGAVLFGRWGVPLLTSWSQILQMYLACCIAGNFASIYFPTHIRTGAMRAQGGRFMLILVNFAMMAVIGILMIPTALCLSADAILGLLGKAYPVPVGFIASLLLLAGTAALYRLTLTHAGDILQEREQLILESLWRDRE